MDGILQWIFVYIFVFGGGAVAAAKHLLDRHYRHRQAMKQLEAEKARALADRTQAQLAARVLDMRLAEQSIEQFDRRAIDAGLTPPPRLVSNVDPDALREITDGADRTIDKVTQENPPPQQE